MAGIYIHVPFCKTRCLYCDFFSTTEDRTWKDRYIQALRRELELRSSYLGGEPVETLYFGGGTPSQLQPQDFEQLFDTIQSLYGWEPGSEITLEANPDDLSAEYIRQLARLPFNRISIGIQTFNDQALKSLHRRHTAGQATQAIQRCREAGFANISIDLMYGLPQQTEEEWKADLRQAIELGIEHISAYHLIYEEGTGLWKMREQHLVEEAEEEKSVKFFALLIEQLKEAGYTHYEISNFCRPGKHSRHNSSYWTGKKYLGCGPSAHSFDGDSRQWNVSSLPLYIKSIEQGIPDIEKEWLDTPTRYNDFIITSLRTCWGLSLKTLTERFGRPFYRYFFQNARPHIESGKLIHEKDTVRLSSEGIFISDGIMSDLLWVEE